MSKVKIYTWKSGVKNILCDKCADEMFFKLMDRIVCKYPNLTKEQYQELDSVKELNDLDITAQITDLKCQPIVGQCQSTAKIRKNNV